MLEGGKLCDAGLEEQVSRGKGTGILCETAVASALRSR